MPPEATYRIALLTIFGLTLVIVGYHRWQAAKSGERISRKDEGLLFAIVLRLVGLCLWVAALAYLINPSWMECASVPLPSWLRWLGAGVGVMGCALTFWTLTNLGKNLTDTVVTRANATLVTTGPYRWVRHPFYVAIVLLITSIAFLAANWFVGLIALLFAPLLFVRTRKEEQKLIEKFGDQYRAYMARTGKFWPKVGSKGR